MDGEARHEPMSGIGPLLRAYRLRVGGNLDEAAATLHIRRSFLQAIEEGRYGELPGPAYASGFVRAYADYLGLDGDEVLRRFKMETGGTNASAELHFPTPTSESASPQGSVILVGTLIALVAYGAWYVVTARDGFFAEIAAPLPDRFATLLNDGEGEGAAAGRDAPTAMAEIDIAAVQGNERATGGVAPPDSVVPATGGGPSDGEPRITGLQDDLLAPDEPAPDERAPDERAPDEPGSSERITVGEIVSEAPASQSLPATAPAAAFPATASVAANGAGQAEARADGDREPGSSLIDPPARPAVADPPSAGSHADAMAAEPFAQVAALPAAGDEAGEGGRETGRASEANGAPGSSATDEQTRVVLQASERSWVEIQDRFGNRIMSRLMSPGEVYEVPDQTGLRLTVGNAGGLAIRVDGSAVPALGGPGVVRRNVPLEPERLQRGDSSTY